MQRQLPPDYATQDANRLLQALHALEAARGKEMRAHGERTQQLERVLDASQRSEKDLQLAVAKLRAEKCCAEGEAVALKSKVAARDQDILVLTQRQEMFLQDLRQRLIDKETTISDLTATINQLRNEETTAKIKQSVDNADKESLRREQQRIEEVNATQAAALLSTKDAVITLTAQVAAQAVELRTAQHQNEACQQQLSIVQAELRHSQEVIATLIRRCEKLEVTRIRLAGWKRAQLDLLEEALTLRDVFLEWKAQSLATLAARTKSASAACTLYAKRLENVHVQLRSKLHHTRDELRANKTWIEVQQSEMIAWKSLCAAQFSTLVADKIAQAKREMIAQHTEVRAMHNEELCQVRRQFTEQMEITANDTRDRKARYKKRVEALVSRVDYLYRCQLRILAFQGWKDVYLRNLIGKATHALMVVRSATRLNAVNTQHSERRKKTAVEYRGASDFSNRHIAAEVQRWGSTKEHGWDPHTEEDQLRRLRRVTSMDARTFGTSSRVIHSLVTKRPAMIGDVASGAKAVNRHTTS